MRIPRWQHVPVLTRVACPILAPRFISAFLLLFASAFSAYATAAALFSQRSILVPLMIQGAMRNELDPNQQGFARCWHSQ